MSNFSLSILYFLTLHQLIFFSLTLSTIFAAIHNCSSPLSTIICCWLLPAIVYYRHCLLTPTAPFATVCHANRCRSPPFIINCYHRRLPPNVGYHYCHHLSLLVAIGRHIPSLLTTTIRHYRWPPLAIVCCCCPPPAVTTVSNHHRCTGPHHSPSSTIISKIDFLMM